MDAIINQNLKPDNLNRAYDLAYSNACESFARWNPLDMALSSGGDFDISTKRIAISYVNDGYKIHFPSGEIVYDDKVETVPTAAKIVLLHYLVRAGGQPTKNEWISFKEIPGGMLYFDAFKRRIINYLIAVFGGKPAMLLTSGIKLGGKAVKCGDYGVQINVLPKLPVIFALWSGDEEFPPRATVLFDATAPFYLPTEDIVVAIGFAVSKLAKAVR